MSLLSRPLANILSYKPPEVYSADAKKATFDVRKCDLWTVGLVCWEILANGKPYFENHCVRAAMGRPRQGSVDPSLFGSTLGSAPMHGEYLQRSLNAISGQLCHFAQGFVADLMLPLASESPIFLKLFENLLQVDAASRSPQALFSLFSKP